MSDNSYRVATFIKYVKDEIKKAGGTINMANSRSVTYTLDDSEVNGYWDHNRMELACAIGQPQENWLPIFVHEYAHFTQWQEQCETWVKAEMPMGDEETKVTYSDLMWEWMEGSYFPVSQIKGSLDAARELEADCERRSLKLIKKFQLPICTKFYAKKSNAYVHFYNAIFRFKKWYEIGKEPYNIPEILDVMPDTICDDFSETPEAWMDLYKEHCFEDL